jgi:2-polyprenyl-3-methyl-5-hydroxy-6-metoxy-1,4-benzoquinol methylase
MALNARSSIIRSLLPEHTERLLDVGCGPITSGYPYADKAPHVTCVDWKLQVAGPLPSNIECLAGDFMSMDLGPDAYDSIIAADVFEHVLLEEEPHFVGKCLAALRPGGNLVISVPHQGTFAYLDPYQVKPTIHRALASVGLYKGVHNGCCDIRKGHKHYVLQELIEKFSPLKLSQVVYFGYVFDPLLSWAVALSRKGSGRVLHSGITTEELGFPWLQRACRRELDRDYGPRSFNVVASFYKPPTTADDSAAAVN